MIVKEENGKRRRVKDSKNPNKKMRLDLPPLNTPSPQEDAEEEEAKHYKKVHVDLPPLNTPSPQDEEAKEDAKEEEAKHKKVSVDLPPLNTPSDDHDTEETSSVEVSV